MLFPSLRLQGRLLEYIGKIFSYEVNKAQSPIIP